MALGFNEQGRKTSNFMAMYRQVTSFKTNTNKFSQKNY